MTTTDRKAYYAAAIAAFLIWGFIPLPIRALGDYTSMQILFYRLSFALSSLLLITIGFRREAVRETIQLYQHSSRQDQRQTIFCSIAGGILLSANWLIFIYVMNNINVQTASFSYLICPIITALLSVLIIKEKLKSHQWLAILISLASCSLIGIESWLNLLYSLLVAATYAFYLITQRIVRQYDRLVILTLQLAISFVIIAPLYLFLDAHSLQPTVSFYTNALILALIFTVLPLFLNLYALNELKSSTIGILMYINPVVNFSVAFLYYHESAGLHQVGAYALIMFSIVVYNWNPSAFSLSKSR